MTPPVPPEIWLQMLEVGWLDLDPEDIKSLTLVQKTFREISQPYIFARQRFTIPITFISDDTSRPIYGEENRYIINHIYHERCKSRLEFISQDRIVSAIRMVKIESSFQHVCMLSQPPPHFSNFVHPNIVLNTIFTAIKSFHHLDQFGAYSLRDIQLTHSHLGALSSLKYLSTIVITGCHFDLESFRNKETLPIPSLKVLSLTFIEPVLDIVRVLLSSSLEVLDLDISRGELTSRDNQSTTVTLLRLLSSKSSPSLSRLKSLGIRATTCGDLTSFLEMLKKVPSLKTIKMIDCSITMFRNPPTTYMERFQESLMSDIAIVPHLESVSACYHIAVPFMKSRSLRSVTVSTRPYARMTSEIASQFQTVTGIGLIPRAHWRFLNEFDMDIYVADQAFECVLSALPMFQHLTNLTLSIRVPFHLTPSLCHRIISYLPESIKSAFIGIKRGNDIQPSQNLLNKKTEANLQQRYPALGRLFINGGPDRSYLMYPPSAVAEFTD
ncbi:hypothetical protein C8Q75DRAFT_787251 [Abortiporus biennis]|nr:hypothetical protein C8Q75DRAFT_787251 [Abortiporus biennis]